MTPKRKIRLIFTRDFDQWVQEACWHVLVYDLPKVWGRGLSDQIIYFDGRTFGWYRFEHDMLDLKNFVINKPLTDKIFDRDKHNEFVEIVYQLRVELTKFPTIGTTDGVAHLKKLSELFRSMYPFYPLGIFIAGPWRDDFIKIHGEASKAVLDILMHSREKSEGVLKLVGLHLRQWLGPFLASMDYDEKLVRLLTTFEVEEAVAHKILPTKHLLVQRQSGFVFFQDRLKPIEGWDLFLKENNLELVTEDIDDKKLLKGSVAYGGGKISGFVQKIFNSFEAVNFKKGSILVTPMTSPEYLPAMKLATAIITDEGGITCHAAIVARELKKPCIIGTKIATRVFKDGDIVEVDADNGLVRIVSE